MTPASSLVEGCEVLRCYNPKSSCWLLLLLTD